MGLAALDAGALEEARAGGDGAVATESVAGPGKIRLKEVRSLTVEAGFDVLTARTAEPRDFPFALRSDD
jgi:hypothetical protein